MCSARRPYDAGADASLDPDLRFGGATTIGLAAVWVHAARQVEPSTTLVRLLAFGLLAGGLVRVVAAVLTGVPGPVTVAQTVVGVVVPVVVPMMARPHRLRPST